MRDSADLVTCEIPGVEPPPQRKTEKQRRKACAYQGPKEVTACRNCTQIDTSYRNPDSLRERLTHQCKLHRFEVELGAVCAEWCDNRRAHRHAQAEQGAA